LLIADSFPRNSHQVAVAIGATSRGAVKTLTVAAAIGGDDAKSRGGSIVEGISAIADGMFAAPFPSSA